MRTLTLEEIGQIAGGSDEVSSVVVTANKNSRWETYTGALPTGGGGGGGIAVGGGGGSGSAVGVKAGETHKTKGGVTYKVQINLSAAQVAAIDAIVDYGTSHGFTPDQIGVVVGQAFYESSLGTIMNNPTHFGMFQYSTDTWNDLGHTGNINSQADQITAMYQDLVKYNQRYIDGQASGAVPGNLYFAEYFEVKHHLGNNSQDWTNPFVAEYDGRTSGLGFTY